jgi:hypothetical protein
MKFLFPIINIALAAVLFFGVTDKMFVNAPLDEKPADKTGSTGGIRALIERRVELNAAIIKAKELGKRVNELNSQFNSFTQEQKDKLDLLLPDYVNNIQLIIDVNGIAKRNSMVIKNIKVTTSEDKDANSSKKLIVSKNQALGTMLLSFSVTGPYNAYKSFLADLASSLRIIDISSTSFSTDDKGIYTYNVELRTYWLK